MSIYSALAELEKSGSCGAVCTIIRSRGSTPRHTGSKMLVYADGHFIGTVGGGEIENRVIQAAVDSVRTGQTQILSYDMVDPKQGDPGVCGGTVEVLVEPILPRPMVLIIGAGHVGKAVAHLAHWLGFRVAVSDDRVDFCTPDVIPEADDYYPGAMAELPNLIPLNGQTYVVLTTRGVAVDVAGLPALIDSPVAYLGVIGSKRRWLMTRNTLQEAGISEEQINRVVSPVGLELNAETPEEIAVSIMAQIIMLRNGGTGSPMKV